MQLSTTPDEGKLRRFGAIWLPLALLLLFRSARQSPFAPILLVFAAVVFLVALVFPRTLRPVFVGLMYLTAPMGYVVSRVLLTLVYFLVVTPLGWFRRRRADVLGIAFDRSASTYWKNSRPGARSVASYFRQSNE